MFTPIEILVAGPLWGVDDKMINEMHRSQSPVKFMLTGGTQVISE